MKSPLNSGRPNRRPKDRRPPHDRPAIPSETRKPRPDDTEGERDEKRRQHDSADELKYHGRHACHALFANRPDDIIRVYATQERLKEFGPLLKWCAEQRRAYHIVETENLNRLADTVHHQGVVVLARKPKPQTEADLERIARSEIKRPILLLDGVQNPHNLGSILRTAAHFGVAAVIGQREQLPGVTASAARVAEGGMEVVPTIRLKDVPGALRLLKANGYRVLTSTSHPGGNVYGASLSAASVIVLGNEVSGVSPEVAALADASLQIPGTGAVESLNVGVACGVLLSEVARQAKAPTPTKPHGPGRPGHERSGGSPGKSRHARSRSRR
jgi:TrmH RNA methyltransferase